MFTDNIENIINSLQTIPNNQKKINALMDLTGSFGYDNITGTVQTTRQDVIFSYFRRSVLLALFDCVSNITFASSDDAISTIKQVARITNAEIVYSFDNSDDDIGYVFTRCLSQLTAYISKVSADLPNVVTETFGTSLPACVIAYQYYQDATRDDEIISRNNPIMPAALSTTVELLQY